LQYLIDKLTDLQLIGPIDVLVHLRNMFSAIAGSQGGGSASWDIMRKIPGVRGLDTIVRIVKNTRDVMLDTPGVQKEIASFTRIGAGRGAVEHIGVIQKYLPTGKLVTLIDKASRLTLSRMYDNLVEREWAKDTEEGRREFINRMGQYNTRLMGKWTQQLKQSSISSFVVAGKNFNRLALQRLILNPGVEAANPQAALKMKLVDAVGFISTMMTLPMVINYYTTGSIWGRPGVAPGAIDTGETKNGKPVELDLVQNILIRRGLNISGGSVAYKDYKQGRGGTEMLYDAFLDQIRGFASPYEGPAVKFLTTAITGHDTGGYLQSDNPHNLGENFLAALKQANPSVMKYFQAKEEGTSEAAGVLQPLTQWAGYGTGHKPSLVEQEQAVPGIEKMNLKKRADVQQSFTKSEIPLTPKQHLIMEQGAKDKADQVKEKVNSELKPETQTWLKSQKLEVPGFVEYLEQTGVKVYLLPKEREQYMEIMVKSYEDAIRKAKPFVENMKTQEQKKKVLEVYLRSAHGIAKNKMKNLIGK
jgi:hypothetical protein